MTSEEEKKIATFKTFHVLILGCLLSTLLILNSNYVNEKRATLKLNEEKSKLFDEIIAGRHLQGQNSPFDKVCAKGSEDLVEYYKTGELEKIGLEDGPIKAEKETYLTALINIIKTFTGEDESKDSEGDVTSSGEGTLRNLQSLDAVQDDLVNYVKHLLPILAFFVIAILAIPGWIICCFCCCCNCCCCCCCKKPGCKLPCFIFTNVFYALVVAICIYGLSQSNNVLKGMASTECSILKFFEQFLDGETKQQSPRWAGITIINNILNDLSGQITNMQGQTKTDLNDAYEDIEEKRDDFLGLMYQIGDRFLDVNDKYLDSYIIPKNIATDPNPPTQYDFSFTNSGSNYNVKGRYVLDLIRGFGRYNSADGFYPQNSVLYLWNQEYLKVSEEADKQLDNAHQGFTQILDTNSVTIIDSLNDGKQALNDLRGTFDDIKSSIADIIVDNYETIDDNGKLGFKCVFGVLALFNIAIAAFMFLICFFSGKLCAKCCCCCRCLFKCAVHLLWNILALLMIITFLVGFLVALIGQLGSDVMSVISFVISADNIGNNGDNILVDALGDDVKGYINRCVNGDGKIEEQLGLNAADISSFDKIYQAENTLNQAKENFDNIQYLTYDKFRENIIKDEILELKRKFYLVDNVPGSKVELDFETILNEMNAAIGTLNTERWGISSTDSSVCQAGGNTGGNDGTITGNDRNPRKCKPYDRDWIYDLTSSTTSNYKEIQDRAKILTDAVNCLKEQSEEESSVTYPAPATTFLGNLNQLKSIYQGYINQYKITLTVFQSAITNITGKLKQFSGNSLFSFIKCTFIGTNLKIMLKYLKSALGGDVKTVGICLLVVGCSLALSISATILMIIIINIDIENNKKKDNGQVPIDSQGRLIQFK